MLVQLTQTRFTLARLQLITIIIKALLRHNAAVTKKSQLRGSSADTSYDLATERFISFGAVTGQISAFWRRRLDLILKESVKLTQVVIDSSPIHPRTVWHGAGSGNGLSFKLNGTKREKI